MNQGKKDGRTGPVAQRIRRLTTNQEIPGSNPGRIVFGGKEKVKKNIRKASNQLKQTVVKLMARGLMDKASDFESEDSRFES